MRRLIPMLLLMLAATACELAPDDGTTSWGAPDATLVADSFGAEAATVATPATGTVPTVGAPRGRVDLARDEGLGRPRTEAPEAAVDAVLLAVDPAVVPVLYVMHGDPEPWRAPAAGQGASTPAGASTPILP